MRLPVVSCVSNENTFKKREIFHAHRTDHLQKLNSVHDTYVSRFMIYHDTFQADGIRVHSVAKPKWVKLQMLEASNTVASPD